MAEDTMLRETEALLKAVADRTRLRILSMLDGGPLCVCQVVEVLGLAQSTVSKHLALLTQAGLVVDERRGRWTYYALSPESRKGPRGRLLAMVQEALAQDPQSAKDAQRACCPAVKALLACCPPKRGKRSQP
jgi:arsenate reductase/ArsR family transcriptional regulator